MSRRVVLLTGATGMVGSLVLTRLLDRRDSDVVCVVRAEGEQHAQARLEAVLTTLYGTIPGHARSAARAVALDLAHPAVPPALASENITHVLHCAANVRFDLARAEARRANVLPTAVMTMLARGLPHLQRFVHVSTAYAAGTHRGRFAEEHLDLGQDFRNTYEATKFQAECLLRESARDLPVVVARPSIVIGEAQTGWTPAFSTIYPLLRAYARGNLSRIAADPDALVDIVTGDYVADALVHLLLDAPDPSPVHHLVAGAGAPTVAELCQHAAALLHRPPIALAAPDPQASAFTALAGYLDVHTRFDDAHTRALLAPAGLVPVPPDQALQSALRYAATTNWGRHPESRAATRTRTYGKSAA